MPYQLLFNSSVVYFSGQEMESDNNDSDEEEKNENNEVLCFQQRKIFNSVGPCFQTCFLSYD